MTKEQALKITNTSTRCTQATLRAFGIEGYPYYGSGCLEYLTKNGYKITPVPGLQGKTMEKLRNECPSGYYLILTKGHAMALCNEILIDTAPPRGSRDNRKIEHVWLVEGSSD